MNSLAWAVRAAAPICSRPASSRPQRMFSSTVSGEQDRSLLHSGDMSTQLGGVALADVKPTRLLLPAPVEPMIPKVWPTAQPNETSRKAGSVSAPP